MGTEAVRVRALGGGVVTGGELGWLAWGLIYLT